MSNVSFGSKQVHFVTGKGSLKSPVVGERRTWANILPVIIMNESTRNITENVRKAKAENDLDQANKFKQSLPGVQFSLYNEEKRLTFLQVIEDHHMFFHSRLPYSKDKKSYSKAKSKAVKEFQETFPEVWYRDYFPNVSNIESCSCSMVDLDKFPTPELMEQTRQELCRLPYVGLVCVTASGKGLRAVINHAEYSLDIEDHHKSTELYQSIRACVQAKIMQEPLLSEAVRDAMVYKDLANPGVLDWAVVRNPHTRTFLAYDPDAYFNAEATELPLDPTDMGPDSGFAFYKKHTVDRKKDEDIAKGKTKRVISATEHNPDVMRDFDYSKLAYDYKDLMEVLHCAGMPNEQECDPKLRALIYDALPYFAATIYGHNDLIEVARALYNIGCWECMSIILDNDLISEEYRTRRDGEDRFEWGSSFWLSQYNSFFHQIEGRLQQGTLFARAKKMGYTFPSVLDKSSGKWEVTAEVDLQELSRSVCYKIGQLTAEGAAKTEISALVTLLNCDELSDHFFSDYEAKCVDLQNRTDPRWDAKPFRRLLVSSNTRNKDSAFMTPQLVLLNAKTGQLLATPPETTVLSKPYNHLIFNPAINKAMEIGFTAFANGHIKGSNISLKGSPEENEKKMKAIFKETLAKSKEIVPSLFLSALIERHGYEESSLTPGVLSFIFRAPTKIFTSDPSNLPSEDPRSGRWLLKDSAKSMSWVDFKKHAFLYDKSDYISLKAVSDRLVKVTGAGKALHSVMTLDNSIDKLEVYKAVLDFIFEGDERKIKLYNDFYSLLLFECRVGQTRPALVLYGASSSGKGLALRVMANLGGKVSKDFDMNDRFIQPDTMLLCSGETDKQTDDSGRLTLTGDIKSLTRNTEAIRIEEKYKQSTTIMTECQILLAGNTNPIMLTADKDALSNISGVLFRVGNKPTKALVLGSTACKHTFDEATTKYIMDNFDGDLVGFLLSESTGSFPESIIKFLYQNYQAIVNRDSRCGIEPFYDDFFRSETKSQNYELKAEFLDALEAYRHNAMILHWAIQGADMPTQKVSVGSKVWLDHIHRDKYTAKTLAHIQANFVNQHLKDAGLNPLDFEKEPDPLTLSLLVSAASSDMNNSRGRSILADAMFLLLKSTGQKVSTPTSNKVYGKTVSAFLREVMTLKVNVPDFPRLSECAGRKVVVWSVPGKHYALPEELAQYFDTHKEELATWAPDFSDEGVLTTFPQPEQKQTSEDPFALPATAERLL